MTDDVLQDPLARSKRAAIAFLEATFARDPDRAAAVLADDATYWAGGKHARFQRLKTKADWCDYLGSPSPFDNGLALTIKAVTAEADRVAVELEGYGVVSGTGAIYNNTYHFLFTVANGRIATIREYMDTAHVLDVLPLPQL